MPRKGQRSYTEPQFRDALADPEVTTIADLCRAIGIVPCGGNYESLRRYAAELDLVLMDWLPASRDRRAPHRGEPVAVDDGELTEAIASATSLADVLRALGLSTTGSNYRRLRAAIHRLGLSTDHMAGRGWARGRSFPQRRTVLDEYLVVGGPVVTTSKLRARLIEKGVKERRCERCERSRWMGEAIPLELDHVNGDRRDNRLENLRLLCPNCHALTPTYRGRNIGNYD